MASFDRANYFPQYWDVLEEAAAKFEESNGRAAIDFEPFRDEDETAQEFGQRYTQWQADQEQLREIQQSLGIRLYRYSSIMDYHGTVYGDWQGLGIYDKAAMRFIYGGLVDRVECEGTQPEDCLDKDEDGVRKLYKRSYVKWYAGGEMCSSDEDCPFQNYGQKCVVNSDVSAVSVQTGILTKRHQVVLRR